MLRVFIDTDNDCVGIALKWRLEGLPYQTATFVSSLSPRGLVYYVAMTLYFSLVLLDQMSWRLPMQMNKSCSNSAST